MTQENIISPASNNFTMLKAMVGIGVVCGFLIVFTYENTLPRIEKLKSEALQKAVFQVLPGVTEVEGYVYLENKFTRVKENEKPTLFAGYDDSGKFKGVAIQAAGQGYAGTIKVLYGYNPEVQQVVGFYVLESKETPGLGDKIEKDKSFLENFLSLDVSLNESQDALKNKVITVKQGQKEEQWQIDGITGATISSRAIGEIINGSISKWAPLISKNKESFKKGN